jgi:hypothetical protein
MKECGTPVPQIMQPEPGQASLPPSTAGQERPVRRILRAYARCVGDVEALVLITSLAGEIDTAIAEAVKGLRGYGYSWAEIGARLGITRQAVQQRWGASP